MSWPLRCRASLVGSLCVTTTTSYAHSFGTPYILPVPFWMYLYGCAATLIVTFALLGYFVGTPVDAPAAGAVEERNVNAGRAPYTVPRWVIWVLRAGAAGCLLLTILAGLFGNTDPARNIGMTLFWVLFLLGFAYLTVFVGDVFSLLNPWKRLVDGLECMGVDLSTGRIHYPQNLGYWPAFLFYVVLIWIELFVAPKPLTLSIALLTYTAITVAGAALFGKTIWFCKAELFSVFFRLIGKLAPMEYIQTSARATWQMRLRRPFVGALNDRPVHISLVLFVLFMLSSTTYDGIHETALWIGLFWKSLLWLLQPIWGTDLDRAQGLLMEWYLLYRQAGLLLLPFIYLGIYLLVLLWARALMRTTIPLQTLALTFGYSLLPIALAYNFTHYFAFLVVQVQSLPALISDPLGFGWNLLGVQRTFEPPLLQMGVIWHTQVSVLLVGHVISVYLTHTTTLMAFSEQRPIVSQIPLLLLMVIYTTVGLWILSLPLGTE